MKDYYYNILKQGILWSFEDCEMALIDDTGGHKKMEEIGALAAEQKEELVKLVKDKIEQLGSDRNI